MKSPLARFSAAVPTTRAGFTLIELLVVMGIIATLMSMLLPAVGRAREAARRTQCIFQLRQLSVAMLDHYQSKRRLPAGWVEASPDDGLPAGRLPDPGFGWGVALLPELDRVPLFNLVNFEAPLLGEPDRDPITPGDQNNATFVGSQPLPPFRCPSSPAPAFSDNLTRQGDVLMPRQATSNYVACYGSDDVPADTSPAAPGTGAFARNSAVTLEMMTDGESYTLLLGERAWPGLPSRLRPNPGNAYWAGTPDSWLTDVLGSTGVAMNGDSPASFGSHHPQGALFAFADGRVMFLSEYIESFPGQASGPYMGLYQKLGHIQDARTIGDF